MSDLAAEDWYTRVFGNGPDSRPMPGLLKWIFSETFGIQVWFEPDRAGHCSTLLDESDVDALAVRLSGVGIVNVGPQTSTTSRILALTDHDGNRLVFTGPLT